MYSTSSHRMFAYSGLLLALLASLTLLLTTPPHATAAATPCSVLDKSQPIYTGFGAAYNLFSTAKELLVSVACDGADLTVTAGNGSVSTWVYDTGYLYQNNQWTPYTLQCTNKNGSWCPETATKTITNAPQEADNFLVAYTCQWINSGWKCGCDSTSCATPKWQLQAYRGPTSGGSTGGSTDGGTVPQWSLFELDLTSQSSYTNPYLQASVSATFTGPNGIKKTVKGFWDNGTSFKVRFAPTKTGNWSYVTTSSDPGLNGKTGTFTATSPASGNRGFLRADTQYPTSFIWDDGTREMLWGQTYYSIVENARAGNNWKTAIDHSAQYGIKKVRILVYPWEPTKYPDSQPFTGSTASPNHDSLNLAHWQKLDEIISYLDSKHMVADLILLPDNDRVFGSVAQDQRYVRYALARFGAYHNVIWCLSNEWQFTPKGTDYWNTVGGIVRNEDPWAMEGARQRGLSIHSKNAHVFSFAGSSWPAHAILQDSFNNNNPTFTNPDQWGNYGINANAKNRPTVNDEYGYFRGKSNFDQTAHRRAMWGIVTGGGYGSAGDFRKTTLGCNINLSIYPTGCLIWHIGDWLDAPEYGDIQRMITFMNGISFWKMTGHNDLVKSGTRVYARAEPGQQYLVYSAIGSAFSLQLSAGTYSVTQYNPRTGAKTTLSQVNGGTTVNFTLPDSNDWLVYLKRV